MNNMFTDVMNGRHENYCSMEIGYKCTALIKINNVLFFSKLI